MKKAIFASGCFWGPEEKLSKIKGITKAEVGYCGGNNSKTSYEEVCTKVITYEEIVNLFFKIHDPTTFNRQGPNIGSQYRSEIFFYDNEQKKIAEKVKENLNKKLNGKVVTKISKEINYCKAEEYHQKYIQKKGL